MPISHYATILLLQAVLISSSTAYACPELTGRFECVIGRSVSVLGITQSETAEGIATYRIEAEDGEEYAKDLVTDSGWYPVPDAMGPIIAEGEMRSFCEDETLRIEVRGKQGGFPIFMTQWLSLDESDDLENSTQNTFAGFPLPRIEIICDRLD